jgi:hypothetical protein
VLAARRGGQQPVQIVLTGRPWIRHWNPAVALTHV